jgi:hypothetical protein
LKNKIRISKARNITLNRNTMHTRGAVSDQEMKKVIADFLDQGHVENIVALFRHEPGCYAWTGDILRDERFTVRLGVTVLFEELRKTRADGLELAIPSLVRLLRVNEPLLRGEAVSILGIIGNATALAHVRGQRDDPNPQVREMVKLVLEDNP